MFNITLIGAGKAASALGFALKNAGHDILEVWSREVVNSQALATSLGAKALAHLDKINQRSDLYLMLVADDAIEAVASHLHLTTGVIAHCSGIKSMDILKSTSPSIGVFYPFVSMTKGAKIDFTKVQFMIEGNNTSTSNVLISVAKTLSNEVNLGSLSQRQNLHLAAVFANNFTNHLFTIAEKITKENNLDFEMIKQLIHTHSQQMTSISPSRLQTGPAVRGDQSSIETHLELLKAHPQWQNLYRLLTASIIESNRHHD